jgi:hypothetical protein
MEDRIKHSFNYVEINDGNRLAIKNKLLGAPLFDVYSTTDALYLVKIFKENECFVNEELSSENYKLSIQFCKSRHFGSGLIIPSALLNNKCGYLFRLSSGMKFLSCLLQDKFDDKYLSPSQFLFERLSLLGGIAVIISNLLTSGMYPVSLGLNDILVKWETGKCDVLLCCVEKIRPYKYGKIDIKPFLSLCSKIFPEFFDDTKLHSYIVKCEPSVSGCIKDAYLQIKKAFSRFCSYGAEPWFGNLSNDLLKASDLIPVVLSDQNHSSDKHYLQISSFCVQKGGQCVPVWCMNKQLSFSESFCLNLPLRLFMASSYMRAFDNVLSLEHKKASGFITLRKAVDIDISIAVSAKTIRDGNFINLGVGGYALTVGNLDQTDGVLLRSTDRYGNVTVVRLCLVEALDAAQ